MLPPRVFRSFLVQNIAETLDGLDEGTFFWSIDLLADTADADIDDVLGDASAVPDGIDDRGPLENLMGMLEEMFEKIVFLRVEDNLPTGACHGVPSRVYDKVLVMQDCRLGLWTCAPEDGVDPGLQFVEGEGLGQIVVRTRVEARASCVDRVLCREENDGRRIPGFFRRPDDVDAVHLRKTDVEQNDVESTCEDRGETTFAIPFDTRSDPDFVECSPQVVGLFRIVFYYQRVHGATIPFCLHADNHVQHYDFVM